MTIRDEFLGLLRAARVEKLRAFDVEFDRAGKRGEDLAPLRAEYRRLLDLPLAVPMTEDRLVLVAAWPSDFRAIPEAFRNPASVGRLAEAHVVDCSVAPVEEPPAAPVEPIDIGTLRAERFAFAEAEFVAQRAALDADAPTFRSPRAKADLRRLYRDLDRAYESRRAAIEAATTVDALKDL